MNTYINFYTDQHSEISIQIKNSLLLQLYNRIIFVLNKNKVYYIIYLFTLRCIKKNTFDRPFETHLIEKIFVIPFIFLQSIVVDKLNKKK